MQKTEWNRGYFRALYGIYLARKANGDSYALISKMDFDNKATLHSYRREFLDHVRNKLHGDFDRGFFSAWADCMRILSRITVLTTPAPNGSNVTVQEQQQELETVEADKSQVTIENFLTEED